MPIKYVISDSYPKSCRYFFIGVDQSCSWVSDDVDLLERDDVEWIVATKICEDVQFDTVKAPELQQGNQYLTWKKQMFRYSF